PPWAARPPGVRVRAPPPDVSGAVVEAVRAPVLRGRSDRQGVPPPAAMGGEPGDPIVSPWEPAPLVAPRRALPLRLGGKARPHPAGEGVGLVPAHAHHRLVRPEVVAPRLVLPEAGSDDGARLAPGPAGL